jgi:uncharacterized membrane protein YoaT (DUF817 family)
MKIQEFLVFSFKKTTRFFFGWLVFKTMLTVRRLLFAFYARHTQILVLHLLNGMEMPDNKNVNESDNKGIHSCNSNTKF